MEKNKANNGSGSVSYPRRILFNIVSIAAGEIKGVASLYKGNSKNSAAGVKLEFEDKEVIVDIALNIYFGYSVPDVVFQVQENVKNSIETMTEFKVRSINASVLGVTFLSASEHE